MGTLKVPLLKSKLYLGVRAPTKARKLLGLRLTKWPHNLHLYDGNLSLHDKFTLCQWKSLILSPKPTLKHVELGSTDSLSKLTSLIQMNFFQILIACFLSHAKRRRVRELMDPALLGPERGPPMAMANWLTIEPTIAFVELLHLRLKHLHSFLLERKTPHN